MANMNPKVGDVVQTHDGRQGTVRYVGPLKIAAGEWLGLELPDNSGKNDGSVKGERYFTCPPGFGIFVRKESIVEVIAQRAVSTASKVNGGTTTSSTGMGARQRPTSGITADIARKRQSLMSAGSGGAAGSRISTRSPTKSPIKPLVKSSSTSAASTPRTGTPAATNRPSDLSSRPRMSVGPKVSTATRPASTRTTSHTSRPSTGGPVSQTARAATRAPRPLLAGHRPPSQARAISRQEEIEPKVVSQDLLQSPAIEEEGDAEVKPDGSEEVEQDEFESTNQVPPSQALPTPVLPIPNAAEKQSASRNAGAGSVEARTAQQRELEETKAKLRSMEKKQQEDQDKLRQFATIQSEKDRFEKIIQALQKRANVSHQEIIGLRVRCEDAEAKANAPPELSGEHESEMELATIDKEMAEERAESMRLELETLRSRHEELELEVDILREENRELGSVMSPEEKASAGWLQMEREGQRLREALVMLRDLSQQTESELKNEIKELTDNLEETEATANMYTDTAEKLHRAEETNRHLMEQLEAVETNDEVIEAMEAQREQQTSAIGQLKRQVQDLEEHIQVTDELEVFHVDEEKRLHVQLDDTEALLNESNRQNLEQGKVIEDLEYTLTKFRDIVQGLQNDIDELRRSKNISEFEANEMSSKSRAMMDLNLRLQNNAAKTQTKVIETELSKVQANLASKHVEILSNFTIESFEDEKNSVLALLCFGRVKSKASLLGKLLAERLRERAYLSHSEEIFMTYNIMEVMHWISGTCRRFEEFMNSCTQSEFAACGRALFELEPVERTITTWLQALKQDELGPDGPERFRRVQGILIDLAEKFIVESSQSKAMELLVQTQMVEGYAESLVGQFGTLVKLVQMKLGSPTDEDQDSLVFDRKMDHLTTKARTVKYLTSKVAQQMDELKSNLMCLDEISWNVFTVAEELAESFTERTRQVCLAVAREVLRLDAEQPLSYASVIEHMLAAWKTVEEHQTSPHNGAYTGFDIFAILTSQLANIQQMVDDLMTRSSDNNTASRFETSVSPWIVRGKELKARKAISTETQEELTGLNRRNVELSSRIVEREKTIEEMTLRVELAEKRMKDSRARDDKDKALKDELITLRSAKEAAVNNLSALRQELQTLTQKSETDNAELESFRKAAAGRDIVLTAGTSIIPDGQATTQLQLKINYLESELTAMQSAIRFLRTENHTLRVPTTETLLTAARTSWLDPSVLSSRLPHNQTIKATSLQRESTDLYSHLINVATTLKPVRLLARRPHQPTSQDQSKPSSWQPTTQTTRYAVLKQKEEIAEWEAWRDDLLKRAKIAGTSQRSNNNPGRGGVDASARRTRTSRPIDGGGNLTNFGDQSGPHQVKPGDDGAVVIVE